MLCSARTVKAKHIIFQHTNCGSAASGPLRCGTQISAKQDLEKYRKITTEEALVCCLGGVCVQIFPYVPNDVCHQSKDRIVDRNPQVLRSSASNLDVPCDREYRTEGLCQALQTRRHGASRLVGFPSQASRVRLPDARVVHHPVLPHATDGAQWGSATGPAQIQHDKKVENNARLRCDCTTCHSFGLQEADFIAHERRLVGRTRSCTAVALLINFGHQ